MKKSKSVYKKEVQTSIEGFVIGFVDQYKLQKNKSTKDCHKYVLEMAKDQVFILTDSFRSKEKEKIFDEIKNSWLKFIKEFEEFEAFLERKKIDIN
jgi:hypothetical protein